MFFTSPEEDQLFGRVLLGRGPLVGAAYPLYFRVSLQPSIVPGANGKSLPSLIVVFPATRLWGWVTAEGARAYGHGPS